MGVKPHLPVDMPEQASGKGRDHLLRDKIIMRNRIGSKVAYVSIGKGLLRGAVRPLEDFKTDTPVVTVVQRPRESLPDHDVGADAAVEIIIGIGLQQRLNRDN